MAFRQILDSDVDRLTALAIQGVEAFITLYEEDAREERVVAAGPPPRPTAARLAARPVARPALKAPPKARRKRL